MPPPLAESLCNATGEPFFKPSTQRAQKDRELTTLDRAIHIGTAYTRSINLARDADAPDLIAVEQAGQPAALVDDIPLEYES